MAILSSSSSQADAQPSKGQRAQRQVDGSKLPEEVHSSREDGLRPTCLVDYIGQSALKQVLNIAVQASNGRGDALDHVLLLSLIHI